MLTSVRHSLVACALLSALAVAGCGSGPTPRPARPVAAQPLAALAPSSIRRQLASGSEYRLPIRLYRRYVATRLRTMENDVAALREVIRLGSANRARRAWRQANERYRSLGAAYGAFGALGDAVTGRGGPGGGALRRTERALFASRPLRAAGRPAGELASAVSSLRRHVPALRITPLEYGVRVHEILEDTLLLDLTGRANPWSQDAYGAAAGGLAPTRFVLGTLRPLVERRSPGLTGDSEQALRRLSRALAHLSRRYHGYPSLNRVSTRERERVAALVAHATERLAFVATAVDPRPPTPARSPFGKAPAS